MSALAEHIVESQEGEQVPFVVVLKAVAEYEDVR
jgi:hypothetical protein